MFRIRLYIGSDEKTEEPKYIYILGDYGTEEEAEKEIIWICDNSHYLSSLVLTVHETQ